MQNSLDMVIADKFFQKHAADLREASPAGEVEPLGAVFEHMRHFASGRRREVRISLLREADRKGSSDWQSHREHVPEAVSAIAAAVKLLSHHAHMLRPLVSPKLDEVIALASSEEHPLHKMILETALSVGFAREEASWLLKELATIKYRPMQLVCADGFEDFATLLAGISVGEGGLLLAGFVRFTEDPEVDKRLEKIVIRLREQGVTASIFLAFVIVVTAHAVASRLSQTAH